MAVLLAMVCIGVQMLSMKLVPSSCTELDFDTLLFGCCEDEVEAILESSLCMFAACIIDKDS